MKKTNFIITHGSVAQWIERKFPKLCVAGSIPAGAVI